MATLEETPMIIKVKKTKKTSTDKSSKKNKITIQSYFKDALSSLPEEVKQLSNLDFVKSSTEYDIAKAVIELFCKDDDNKLLFKTCGEKSGGRLMWYQFKNHKWNEVENVVFRELISNEFHNLMEQYLSCLVDALENIPDKLKNDKSNEEYIGNMKKLTNKLADISCLCKKTSWKNNITTEAFDKLFHNKFTDDLDKNENLLCCKNGVIDLKNKCFRPGRPEDMCSLSTNINYLNEIENTDDLLELENFVNTIFPFEAQREYMLDHFASTLFGTTQNQTFTYYIGSGSNGKSQIVDLMGHSLGDYKKVIPLQLVTQKRSSIGGTSSEVAQLRGVRYAVLSEPQKGDKLNEGIMKELTGGDTIQARMLFKNTIEFKPMFSLAVCANVFFQIGSDDDGTWRRIKVCEFHSKFVDKKEEDNDLHFDKDKNIPIKLKKWSEIFLHKLVQRAFITQGNVNDCEMVTAATKKYRLSQNRIKQYIDENIIEDKSCKVTRHDLYRDIKEWFENNYKHAIKNRDVCEILDKIYDSTSSHYIGFRLKNEYEDDTLVTKEEIFLKAFNKKYEVTKDRKDFIKSVSLSEWAKLEDFKINSSKAINELLKAEFGLDSKNPQDWGLKKVNGKPIKVWFGIKERTNEPTPEVVETKAEVVEPAPKQTYEQIERRLKPRVKKAKLVMVSEEETATLSNESEQPEDDKPKVEVLAQRDLDFILANI